MTMAYKSRADADVEVNRLRWQLQGIRAYLLQLSSCFAATSGAIGDDDSWLTKPLMVQVVKCILQGCWIAPVVLKHSKQSSSALFQIMREALQLDSTCCWPSTSRQHACSRIFEPTKKLSGVNEQG